MSSDITFIKSLFGTNYKETILQHYRCSVLSRECSLLGRKEVLTGKGKFGIFGDGKELPQVVWSHFFRKGDFRAGYYRDQTLMFALELIDSLSFFAALYGTPDVNEEPMSGGRQMIGHYATEFITEKQQWVNFTENYNISADISCTAGQMPKLVGLAQASKLYREGYSKNSENFSDNGNEIAWGTIGNASTSEGFFYEAINAAGVLQVPMVTCVWDDDYGISVHNSLHTTKGSISEVLKGFQKEKNTNGLEIINVKGWDYIALLKAFQKADEIARTKHTPILIHVDELTQPTGHSTSGSHERYKSKTRLEWEKEYDCNAKFKSWIIENNIASESELDELENKISAQVKKDKREAWDRYQEPIYSLKNTLIQFIDLFIEETSNDVWIQQLKKETLAIESPIYKSVMSSARKLLYYLRKYPKVNKTEFLVWFERFKNTMEYKYSSKLYDDGINSVQNIRSVSPIIDSNSEWVDGRIIMKENFDKLFSKYNKLLVFGEDVGAIGDVNQGFEGMQKKYGIERVTDTGIREATIIGQGIGLALRGFRPIAEIQYLDYILYALATISDDLACYRYRTNGKQIVPLIIRTRGHRLEGIWHSGSPMGGLLGFLRGIHILVPRNMTQAAGFYNTLMEAQEPALVIESLNGYRLKEPKPSNLGEYKTPIGVVETLKKGNDITLVSYGSTLRIVQEVAEELMLHDIDAEVIDIQSLIPFDIHHDIKESVAKTNKLLIIDEDVSGGGGGYILQQLLDKQKIFNYLDSAPQTLSAKEHRPAYSSDGDYFSKPSKEDIFEKVYQIFNEINPEKYPSF